jgi:hypothetical protein
VSVSDEPRLGWAEALELAHGLVLAALELIAVLDILCLVRTLLRFRDNNLVSTQVLRTRETSTFRSVTGLSHKRCESPITETRPEGTSGSVEQQS